MRKTGLFLFLGLKSKIISKEGQGQFLGCWRPYKSPHPVGSQLQSSSRMKMTMKSSLNSNLLLLTGSVALLAHFSSAYIQQTKTCAWAFRSNPVDCSSFFQCNFGSSLLRKCPEGLHWNDKIGACDWRKNAKCKETVSGSPVSSSDLDSEEERGKLRNLD
jgi:hypothetical protein